LGKNDELVLAREVLGSLSDLVAVLDDVYDDFFLEVP
jgi:hypothetical protein